MALYDLIADLPLRIDAYTLEGRSRTISPEFERVTTTIHISGGSFDGMSYDGRACEMNVLERWKYFARDPLYRELLDDAELIDLSAHIFGAPPPELALGTKATRIAKGR